MTRKRDARITRAIEALRGTMVSNGHRPGRTLVNASRIHVPCQDCRRIYSDPDNVKRCDRK